MTPDCSLIVDLTLLLLATGALLDLWFQGSIFEEPRSYFEVRADGEAEEGEHDEPAADAEETRTWWMRALDRFCPDLVVELLNCRFCLSHHVVFWLFCLCLAPAWHCHQPWGAYCRLPLFLLAAIRVNTLLDRTKPDE